MINGDLLAGEQPRMAQMVLMEKGKEPPPSLLKHRAPVGILLLTNKRLFFLSEDTTASLKSTLNYLNRGFKIQFTGQSDIHKLIDSGSGRIKVEPFSSDYSFVLALEQIVACEKVGSRFSLKGKLLRITSMDDGKKEENYWLYSTDPLYGSNVYGIGLDKWFKAIREAMASSR